MKKRDGCIAMIDRAFRLVNGWQIREARKLTTFAIALPKYLIINSFPLATKLSPCFNISI